MSGELCGPDPSLPSGPLEPQHGARSSCSHGNHVVRGDRWLLQEGGTSTAKSTFLDESGNAGHKWIGKGIRGEVQARLTASFVMLLRYRSPKVGS